MRLGAGDLLAQPLALRLDGTVGLDRVPLRLHDGVEDPLLLTLELDERAAAPERDRGAPEPGPSPLPRPTSTVPVSGHGPRISRSAWNCAQISSVTCGSTG